MLAPQALDHFRPRPSGNALHKFNRLSRFVQRPDRGEKLALLPFHMAFFPAFLPLLHPYFLDRPAHNLDALLALNIYLV